MTDVTHRDEIHGDIRFDPLAVALIDTPALQRLGRVYQLGYGHLVYRGGTHTRLSHSMGAYYTAQRLATALRRNYEGQSREPDGVLGPGKFLPRSPSIRGARTPGATESKTQNELNDRWEVLRHLVGWAALLHDAAHVPVGHTLEDEMGGIYAKHDDFASPRLRYLWMGTDSEIPQVLRRTELYPSAFGRLGIAQGDDVADCVLLICTWKERISEGKRTTFQEILQEHINDRHPGDAGIAPELLHAIGRVSPALFAPYMADLVANTISADYLDYLRRDPHNLGLDVLRDDRIVSYFWIGHDHRNQARMALSLVDRRGKPRMDTCTGVVDLVRQRYRFAEIVYYHKTKASASAMLAKALRLVGDPPETPRTTRTLPTIATAGERIAAVHAAQSPATRRSLIEQLKADCTPTALLDPEIGDESLLALMRAQGITKLEKALKADDGPQAEQALRGIALLDGLVRRKLYKAVFAMDFNAFARLIGEPPKNEAERRLGELIACLRSRRDKRDELESALVAAAGWPETALLVYVPGRKSQAKGIETGALAGEMVVTLGSHKVVEEPVEELGEKYADLWRLIFLVHPDYARDALGLSNAVDTFVDCCVPDADLREERVIGDLRSCCWLPYIATQNREAAEIYRTLEQGRQDGHVDYIPFDRVRSDVACTALQRALRGSVLAGLMRRVGEPHALELHRSLGKPDALEARLAILRPELSAGRLGEQDADKDTQALQLAVDRLCDELTGRRRDA